MMLVKTVMDAWAQLFVFQRIYITRDGYGI